MSSFIAFIDDALNIGIDDKAAFRAAKEKLKGQEVVVTVNRRPRLQGSQSLRYLRGVVIPDIATACGYDDPDDYQSVYEGLMFKFFRLPDGPFGEPRREHCDKTSMPQERMTQVIDTLIQWAEANIPGCTVRRPEDVNMDEVNEHNVSEVA
jgi:hypothetical protein